MPILAEIKGIPETQNLTGIFDLKNEIGRRDQIKPLMLFWWVFVDSRNLICPENLTLYN
jgi:hypothetical protein